ncbi:MAG TPA: hypothetical protein PLF59_08150 [Cyclobacteriaceae bacterium]|nr:hypothetical protein [Cyclobacteriaceae bacterium]
MFLDAQKVQIRFYCGYGAFGSIPVPNFAWRYMTQYGDLEFRLNNMSTDEEAEVTLFYLPNLDQLKRDIPAVRTNSDTARAAVWYRNPNELKERKSNFNGLRMDLCRFIGCQFGPGLLGTMMRVVP